MFERFVAAGVLVEDVKGRVHRVAVTDSFRDAVDDYRDELDEEILRDSGLLKLIANPKHFFAVGDRALDFGAMYLALADAIESAPRTEDTPKIEDDPPSEIKKMSEFVPGAIFVLEHVMNGYPRTAGTPRGFLSIGGDQIELALACFDRAVLFVWRDDCPTCDSMREEIEVLLDERELSVPLLSLFGPEATATFCERYAVFGAPTTLFVRGGEVESRLLGSRYKEAIAGELDALSSQS
jgi:hypothetical protein